jgi:hypothetical protein
MDSKDLSPFFADNPLACGTQKNTDKVADIVGFICRFYLSVCRGRIGPIPPDGGRLPARRAKG